MLTCRIALQSRKDEKQTPNLVFSFLNQLSSGEIPYEVMLNAIVESEIGNQIYTLEK